MELPNTVEGLVRMSDLADDYYIFDEKNYELTGERTGRTYKLGQSVRVAVSGTDSPASERGFCAGRRAGCVRYSGRGRRANGRESPGVIRQPEREIREKELDMGKDSIKLIANNKKAYHDYFIDDKYEAGIELFGTEVKSIRMGKCSVKEAFVKIDNGQVYVYGMHISPYEKGNIFNKDPLRTRKLLLHKSEIMKLTGKVAEKGYTLVPLQVYFKGSLVKVEIGLARGKKLYDKRADIAKKDQRRELEREFKVGKMY